jgi:MFS family permease
MLGILTQGLNFGTVNVALPSMMTNLRADVETIQWVVTAFMITRTVAMPAVGWVAAAQGELYAAGEWDLLPTKAMLLVRKVMLDEAAVMAYRDCYMAIAVSSLVSLVLTLFLRLPRRRR